MIERCTLKYECKKLIDNDSLINVFLDKFYCKRIRNLKDGKLDVEINDFNDFVKRTYTQKQFHKLYQDISEMIKNIVELYKAINNGEIV